MRIGMLSLIVACCLLAVASLAQDETAPVPDAAVPQAPPAEPRDDTADQAEEDSDDDEFEFLDEIPAETQLVFPVDI